MAHTDQWFWRSAACVLGLFQTSIRCPPHLLESGIQGFLSRPRCSPTLTNKQLLVEKLRKRLLMRMDLLDRQSGCGAEAVRGEVVVAGPLHPAEAL